MPLGKWVIETLEKSGKLIECFTLLSAPTRTLKRIDCTVYEIMSSVSEHPSWDGSLLLLGIY